MSSNNKPQAEYSDETEDSDDSNSTKLEELTTKLKELSQCKSSKAKAKASLILFQKRYLKKERLPSRPCGDILPYRYSSNLKVNLGKDVVSIVVFVNLARYLTKTQVKNLARHSPTLEKAKALLQEEKDFPSWFEYFTDMKISNRKMAFDFFYEVTDAIKAEFSPELTPSGTVKTRSSNPVEATIGSDYSLPEPKRRRVEQLEIPHNNSEPISRVAPPEGSSESSMGLVTRREQTQGILVSPRPHSDTTQIWDLQTSSGSQSLSGESFGNSMGLIASGEQVQEQGTPVFSPIFYLPTGFTHKYSGLFTSHLDIICGPYLSGAMKTSCLWDGGAATHCFGVAFPGNPYDDALVVISVSQLTGCQLIEFTLPTLPTPSLHGPHIPQGL